MKKSKDDGNVLMAEQEGQRWVKAEAVPTVRFTHKYIYTLKHKTHYHCWLKPAEKNCIFIKYLLSGLNMQKYYQPK